jgi:hypothetical protein
MHYTMNSHERYNQPDRQRSLQALTAEEADRRAHVFARLSDVFDEALSDSERYVGHDVYVETDGTSESISIIRMDSRYPIVREDYALEPNHLTFFIPDNQPPHGITRFWAEWDIKRAGTHSHIVDETGARPFERLASKRQTEEQDQRTRLEQEIDSLKSSRGDVEVGEAIDGLYDNAHMSLEILAEFYDALTRDYQLVPFRNPKI